MSKSMQFGPLLLQFTTAFEERWNDRGSGADHDGGFWHPKGDGRFRPLGSIGVNGYGNPNGQVAALLVAAADEGTVTRPKEYRLIWTDEGSGANQDGSCWRPVPEDGYVALGDVFVRGYERPSVDDVWCVRADLALPALVGSRIWNDAGSGADHDFGAWEIVTPLQYVDTATGLVAPNTFVGVRSHGKPSGEPVMHCLHLPLPVRTAPEPEPPELTGRKRPSATTPAVIDHAVTVPFTAVHDPDRTVAWKVENSPFYDVERSVLYRLVLFDDNTSDRDQASERSETIGISQARSETFSVTTGVSVTAESGVSFLGTGGKVSATITVELGYEQSTHVEQFSEETVKVSMVTPPDTATAVWVAEYAFQVRRKGEDALLPVDLEFRVNSFVHSQFPRSGTAARAKVTVDLAEPALP